MSHRRTSIRAVLLAAAASLLAPTPCETGETHTFDAAGRLIQVRYDGGLVLHYGYDANGNLISRTVTTSTSASFHRGDPNRDGRVDLSDPVHLLVVLFLGGTPLGCKEAGDANNDAQVDIADAVFLLGYLYQGGPAPPLPGAPPLSCGPDTDAPGSRGDLGCQSYDEC